MFLKLWGTLNFFCWFQHFEQTMLWENHSPFSSCSSSPVYSMLTPPATNMILEMTIFAFELKGMYFVTWVSYLKTCIRYIYQELFLLLFFEALGWKSSWYQPPRATSTCNAEGPQYHQRNLQVEELLAKSLFFGKSIQWPLGATYSLARAKTLKKTRLKKDISSIMAMCKHGESLCSSPISVIDWPSKFHQLYLVVLHGTRWKHSDGMVSRG